MAEKMPKAERNKPISLHGMTPEEALTRALNTPLPDSKVAKKKAEAGKKPGPKKPA
jgi:hypothetical protein